MCHFIKCAVFDGVVGFIGWSLLQAVSSITEKRKTSFFNYMPSYVLMVDIMYSLFDC